MAPALLRYDPELQEIAAYAAEALDAPIALVAASVADGSALLAGVGLGQWETAVGSLLARLGTGEGPFELADAAADPRLANDPLVTGGPCVRFLAGVAFAGGALWVMGPEPRTLRAAERRALAFLARQAETRLALRKAEDEARRSAEMLRLVTDRVPVRIAYVDREYRFRFLNDAYLTQVGLAKEHALGRTLSETLGEAMYLQAKPNLDRALAGETHTQEFEALYNTGTRPVRATYVPDRDAEGRVQGVAIQVEDLTERRAVEAARDAGEAHYATLFESLDDGFCTFETLFDGAGRCVDYRFLEVNDAFVAQTGLTRERVLGGRTIRELVPTLEAHWFEMYGRVATTGEPLRVEEDARGLGRRYEVHAFRIGGEGSRKVAAIFKDVTARHAAERALAVERERLERTLDAAGIATFEWDIPGDHVGGNRLLNLYYGVAPGVRRFSVTSALSALRPEEEVARSGSQARALAEGGPYETHYRRIGADGRERWLLIRGDVELDADGRAAGATGVVLDVTERARAAAERERLLEEVEMERAKLRAIFEQAPAIIGVLSGRELVFDYVNRGFYEIVGDRPLLGLPLIEALPEATGSEEAGRDYDRLLLGVMDSGERLTFRERPVTLRRGGDGALEERFLDLAYLPLREIDGTVSGVLVHGIDVTDGVVARKAIAEREELFRTVFEQTPDDAILVMDRDRTLTAWNPAAERITGWTATEAIGQPADLIFTPEDRERGAPQQETEDAARHGKVDDERWHMRFDGARFWGSGTMNALHDAEGNVTGFLKVFRDETARYEETRALAFLRRFTDTIVDTRDPDEILSATGRMLGEHLGVERVAFGVVSEDGTTATVTQDWTNGLASVVGTYRVADFSPQIVWNLAAGLPHVSRDTERDYAPGRGLEAVRALGTRASITTPILKDGRLVSYLLVHSATARDWTEDEIGLVKQVADRVTAEVERARAQAALREANRTLEARVEARTAELANAVAESEGFNYSISHDLRTPLRAVVMTASVLLEEAGPELDEEHRDLLRRQVHNANRMGQLIDELLRLSRLARAEVKRRPLDMTAEARAVAAEIETECVIEVQVGMTADGDEDLVRTVLVNLLENACKFSPAGSLVRMGQSAGAFFVRDEGVGFDMQFAPKIFLPFERLVTEREFAGTGIGLANVKRIVERHGGRVWVESEPGKGATFFFTLGEA